MPVNIVDYADRADAEAVWEALSAESPISDVRMAYPAFPLWASHHLRGAALQLLTLEQNARPVLMLPVVRQRRMRQHLRFRVLAAPKNYLGEHYPLVSGDTEAAIGAFLDRLRQMPGWDVLEIGPMLREWAVTEALQTSARRLGMRPQALPKGRTAFVSLVGGWDEYWGSRRSIRADARRYERLMERQGVLELEEYRGGADLDERLEGFYRVEASGWKGAAGSAIASNPRTRAFYTELAHAFAVEEGLRLYFLHVGDDCVAGEFCLAYRRTIYALTTGYDTAWSDYSPGHVLRKRLLQHLFTTGEADIYDMSRVDGKRLDYKLRWANGTQEHVLLRLFNPWSAKGRLARAAAFSQERWCAVNAWLHDVRQGVKKR